MCRQGSAGHHPPQLAGAARDRFANQQNVTVRSPAQELDRLLRGDGGHEQPRPPGLEHRPFAFTFWPQGEDMLVIRRDETMPPLLVDRRDKANEPASRLEGDQGSVRIEPERFLLNTEWRYAALICRSATSGMGRDQSSGRIQQFHRGQVLPEPVVMQLGHLPGGGVDLCEMGRPTPVVTDSGCRSTPRRWRAESLHNCAAEPDFPGSCIVGRRPEVAPASRP